VTVVILKAAEIKFSRYLRRSLEEVVRKIWDIVVSLESACMKCVRNKFLEISAITILLFRTVPDPELKYIHSYYCR